MDINKIKNMLRNINEVDGKVPGVSVTNKVQKDSEKSNKEYYKDVKKKMSDYTGIPEGENKPVMFLPSEDEQEYINNIRGGKGLEDVIYDNDLTDEFKDRAKKAIVGDSTMGNEVKTGKDDGKGNGNGNTESTWGASDDKQGEKIIAIANDVKKKTDAERKQITQFGDDIEYTPNDGKKPSYKKNGLGESKIKSKKLISKKPFNGRQNAIKLIPESYKMDGYKFQLTDGIETYDVRWDGNITEGEAVVLREANSQLIKEDVNKMFHLLNYDTKEFIKPLDNKQKVNENDILKTFLKENRIVKEEIPLNPKEKSIFSDIIGEDDGSYNMSDVSEDTLVEGASFQSILNKVKSYANKGLLTTAIVGALMTFSQKTFSQEQQSELARLVQQETGIEFSNDVAADIFDFAPEPKPFVGKEIAELNFGKFAEFGNKYFELIEANFNDKGEIIYQIKVNHPLYQEKKDVFKDIVKMNYELKTKYAGVIFEFYGLKGQKIGSWKI